MSENTDLVREAYAAFNATQDPEKVLHVFHPEFSTTVPAELSVEPDTYSGHDGVRRYMGSFYEVMDEVRFELVDAMTAGDWVIAHTKMYTVAHHTGLDSHQELFLAWRFEGRLAIEGRPFVTREEAVAALG